MANMKSKLPLNQIREPLTLEGPQAHTPSNHLCNM